MLLSGLVRWRKDSVCDAILNGSLEEIFRENGEMQNDSWVVGIRRGVADRRKI
jgi:hypothetical protein